jgi:hypothetical protein
MALLFAGGAAADEAYKHLGLSLSSVMLIAKYGPATPPKGVNTVQLRDAALALVNADIKACGISLKGPTGPVELRGFIKPVSLTNLQFLADSPANGAYLVTAKDWDGWKKKSPETLAKIEANLGTRRTGDFVLVHAVSGDNAIDEKKAGCLARIFGPFGLTSLALRLAPRLLNAEPNRAPAENH